MTAGSFPSRWSRRALASSPRCARPDADGYSAVQLGFGEIDPRKVTKPLAGHFAKAGVTPRRYVVELRTADATDYTLGQEVTAETFAPES